MTPELEAVLIPLLHAAVGLISVGVIAGIASTFVSRTLVTAGLTALEGEGVRWTVLLSRLCAVLVACLALSWWAPSGRLAAVFMAAAAWLAAAVPAALILAAAGWYSTSRKAAARQDEDIGEELKWVRLAAGAVAVVSVANLGGVLLLLLLAAAAVMALVGDDDKRAHAQGLWRRWTAGNTLRSRLSDGDLIVHDGQELSVIGSAGLLSTDLLGDEGLLTVPNDLLLISVAALSAR